MKASIKWIENVTFMAESESGHAVVIDGPASAGGRNIGIRPMELLLMGVGGCTSFDVVSILQKSRQSITDCVAQIEAERADTVPSVFTKIHFHFLVSGKNLKENLVKRAINLSAEKYCSASIMLAGAGVAITHSYEISEE
ncbi:MAG: OsmC family protein [Pseudomonadales bacterium]|nr:OsmC family protein [Pseudomonadales bacterium]